MAQHHEYMDRLAAVPLFVGLDKDELEAVAALGTDVQVDAGRELAQEGDFGSEAFLILSGSAVCTRGGEEIAAFGPGDFFGEMALLIHGPRTATITTTSPTSVRAFHRSEFDSLLESSPKVGLKILRTTAERLLRAEDSPRH